jgi:hypothetical protein
VRRKIFRATLLFLLTACITAGPGFLIPAANALPQDSACTYYYSDSSFTTVVGERMLLCNGHIIFSGQVTQFFTTTFEPC